MIKVTDNAQRQLGLNKKYENWCELSKTLDNISNNLLSGCNYDLDDEFDAEAGVYFYIEGFDDISIKDFIKN